jgi:hypothetical protein
MRSDKAMSRRKALLRTTTNVASKTLDEISARNKEFVISMSWVLLSIAILCWTN